MPVSQGSAGGLPGMNLVAWVLLKSDGSTIKALNVSATSRTGSGTYTVTFAAALSTAEYLVRATEDGRSFLAASVSSKTTAGFNFATYQTVGTYSPSDRTMLLEVYA